MSKGRTIRMFLVDGSPTGIITAEIMNWTGHVLSAPRSRLADLIKRPEAGRTGIYVLSGIDPDTGNRTQVYIGESDNVGKRLTQHNRTEENGGKDFWDRACLITSKDPNLTKAHVRYLESRLISLAGRVGRARVCNGTAPEYGLLPEADLADMDFFLEQIRTILPVLGLDFLRDLSQLNPSSLSGQGSDAESASAQATETAVIFELSNREGDISASAREVDGDFIVFAGSTARNLWVGDPKHSQNYRRLHEQLCEDGILKERSGLRVFTQDYPFSSPSAAAAVVFGRSANGRISWKVRDSHLTYAEYQESQIEAAEPYQASPVSIIGAGLEQA